MRLIFEAGGGTVSTDISMFDISFSNCSPYTQIIEDNKYWLIAPPPQSDNSFVIACGAKSRIMNFFNKINFSYANEAKILDLRNEQ